MAADAPMEFPLDPGTVQSAARAHAPDLYLSALLAPRTSRADLIALAAYLGEIGRIPLQPSEAMVGIIRLQWWREAIEAGRPTGNPVADALLEAVARRALPLVAVLAPLDAYDHLITEGALREEVELHAYLQSTAAQSFALAAAITRGAPADAAEALFMTAGEAMGRATLAAHIPYYLAAHRLPLPLSRLAGIDPRSGGEQAEARVREATGVLMDEARAAFQRARELFAAAERPTQAAVLPLALVEPYLRALQRPGRDTLRQPAEISPLVRAGALWLARWRRTV